MEEGVLFSHWRLFALLGSEDKEDSRGCREVIWFSGVFSCFLRFSSFFEGFLGFSKVFLGFSNIFLGFSRFFFPVF